MSDSSVSYGSRPAFAPRVAPASNVGELPTGFEPLRLLLDVTDQVLELTRPEMVAGRHSGCDLHIIDPEISRRHCRFLFHDGAWVVEDRHSLNGVFVNDEQVLRHALTPGDRVRIGGVTMVVQPPEARTGSAVLRSIAAVLPPEHRRAS